MSYTQLVRIPRKFGEELEKYISQNGIEWKNIEDTTFDIASLYTHVKTFSTIKIASIPTKKTTSSLHELCSKHDGEVHIFRFFDENIGLVYCASCKLSSEEPIIDSELRGFIWKATGKNREQKWESDDLFCVVTISGKAVNEDSIANLLGCKNDPDAIAKWDKEKSGRYFRFYHRSMVQIVPDEKFAQHDQKTLLVILNVAIEYLLNQSLKSIRDSVIQLYKNEMNNKFAEKVFEEERNKALIYNSTLISGGFLKRANAAEFSEISHRISDQIGLNDLCHELMQKISYGSEILDRLERTRNSALLKSQEESMKRQEVQLKHQEKNIARNMKMLAMFGVAFGYLGSNVILPDIIKSSEYFGYSILIITLTAIIYLLNQQKVGN